MGRNFGQPAAWSASVDVIGSVGLAFIAAECVAPWLGPEHLNQVGLGFVASVAFVAVRRGIRLALCATATSALIYDFFFLEPRYSLNIYDPTDVIAFVLFSVVALIVSNVGARVRSDALLANQRSQLAETMQHFVEALAKEVTLEGLSVACVRRLEASLELDAGVFMRSGRKWQSLAGVSLTLIGSEALDQAVARRDDIKTEGGWTLCLVTADPSAPVCCAIRDRDGRRTSSAKLWSPFLEQFKGNVLRIRQSQEIERIGRDAEYERFRTLLLTSISHDLRSPLAVVRGAAELIRDPPGQLGDDQRRTLANDIIEHVDNLVASLSDVLEMSKLEAGAVQAAIRPCDTRAIIEHVAIAAESIARGHNVRLQVAEPLSPVLADPVLLERALLNLLDNAAKYSSQGSDIEFSVNEDGATVTIAVSDQGDGVDPADLPHVFEKFYRAKRTANRPGSGLGLAIAQGLVEQMGGAIAVKNRAPERGCTFIIGLPRAASKP